MVMYNYNVLIFAVICSYLCLFVTCLFLSVVAFVSIFGETRNPAKQTKTK